MQVVISGIGTAVPEHQCQQHEAGEVAAQFCSATPEQAHMLGILYRMSGVNTRGSVVFDKADGPMTERQEFFPPRTDESPFGPTTEARLQLFAEEAASVGTEASEAGTWNAAELRSSGGSHI